jgi:hypothetical protein
MKMKKYSLLLVALIVLAIALVGCSRVYTTTNPLPLARAVPHSLDFRFDNCNVCHVSDQLGAIIPHADYTTDMCTQAGCHAVSIAPTTTTTPPPTTSTTTTTTTTTTGGTTTTNGTTTTTTTTSAPGNPPIPTDGIDNKTHTAAVYASYKGLCLMCHGAGAGISQYPLPPTYTSRSLSPGTVYSVAPGSPGDHTTRTDAAAGCEGDGCHKAP